MVHRVLVTRKLPSKVISKLEESCDVDLYVGDKAISREELLKRVAGKHAIVCLLTDAIDTAVLDAAGPQLKVVANVAVGYNNIDVAACRARGIAVTNTPDVLTESTADLTWALLLAVARRVAEGDAYVRSGSWPGWTPTQMLGTDVSGKVLGIVGMGRIGQAVAHRAAGFKMRVCYHSRTAHVPDRLAAPWERRGLADLLHETDFLSLHVPLTGETRHLIGPEQLALMKPTAFLINTSRGPVVDETALVTALLQQRLAGAGLDVFEQEPAIHPGLRTLRQVVLLPHLGSATLATRVRMGMICLENIEAVFGGISPPNQVR